MHIFLEEGAIALIELPCDGATTNFEFSFDGGYIDASHISVATVDLLTGVVTPVAFTLPGPWTVHVTPAPAVTKILRIRRLTPMGEPLVDWMSGATVNEANLDKIARQSIFAASDAADTGTIAAQSVRADAVALRLWTPATFANWLSSALTDVLPTTFKGDKGDTGDDSTVPGPVGPAPALTIGTITNIATGGAATAGLRANGAGAYLLDLGLPIGATGSGSTVAWGGISGSLASQTDLVTALMAKADASALSSYATVASLSGYATTSDLTTGLGGKSDTSHTHTFASLTSKPTTLAGYGITDAAAIAHTHTFASLTSKPTTLSGYGITDAAPKPTVSTSAPSGGVDGDIWFKV